MFKFKRQFLSLVSIFSLANIVVFPNFAQAQIRYSPLIIEQTADEQGKARGIIELTNNSQEEFRARVYSEPFTYNKQGFTTLESDDQDLTPYLTFSPRELIIQPGQTRRIRFTSQFLPSTPSGEYRAVLFTETLEQIQQQGQFSLGIKPRFGITVYVRQGETKPNIIAENVSFNPDSKQIELLAKNTGNATTFVNTFWTLSQSGKKISEGETKDFTIIEEGERNILINFLKPDEKVNPGDYQLTGKMQWGNKENPVIIPLDIKVTISPEQAKKANEITQQP